VNTDVFQYTETGRRPWAEQVARGATSLRVTVPATATLVDILAAAYAAGLPKGSQRSGVFEVQTDLGIYTHHNPVFRERGYGRLDPDKAIFQTWEQLEQADNEP
jgi:hypothetical protein